MMNGRGSSTSTTSAAGLLGYVVDAKRACVCEEDERYLTRTVRSALQLVQRASAANSLASLTVRRPGHVYSCSSSPMIEGRSVLVGLIAHHS